MGFCGDVSCHVGSVGCVLPSRSRSNFPFLKRLMFPNSIGTWAHPASRRSGSRKPSLAVSALRASIPCASQTAPLAGGTRSPVPPKTASLCSRSWRMAVARRRRITRWCKIRRGSGCIRTEPDLDLGIGGGQTDATTHVRYRYQPAILGRDFRAMPARAA